MGPICEDGNEFGKAIASRLLQLTEEVAGREFDMVRQYFELHPAEDFVFTAIDGPDWEEGGRFSVRIRIGNPVDVPKNRIVHRWARGNLPA